VGLLIVKMAASPVSLMWTSARSLTFELWRDQDKIRGRFIGPNPGNGVVVAKLGKDGLPMSK
jgi:hypothetical protein